MSRAAIQRLVRGGRVTLAGRTAARRSACTAASGSQSDPGARAVDSRP
jgi:hypothetical protein